jgi:hypothetical protein
MGSRNAPQPAYATLPELLMGMIEAGRLTRKDIAGAAMRSHDWACDLVNAPADPEWWRDLRLMILRLPADAAHDLLALLVCGSAFDPPDQRAADDDDGLDVNGDGKVNLADALDSAINEGRAVNETLEKVRAAQRDGELGQMTTATIVAALTKGQRANQTVVRILTRLINRKGPRLAG